MTRSIRRALTLVALAQAVAGCRHEGEQGPAAAQPVAESPGPLLPAAQLTMNAGGATSAPLPPAPTEAPSSAQPPPEETLRDRAPLSDEQIAAVSAAADRAALDQAVLARARTQDAAVRKLADRFAAEHGDLNKSRAELSKKLGLKVATSPLSDELATDGASSLGTLKKTRPADFDSVYLDAQSRAHQRFLELLDAQLIPNAKNVDLKQFLQTARARTQSQLELVQQLTSARAPKTAADKPK